MLIAYHNLLKCMIIAYHNLLRGRFYYLLLSLTKHCVRYEREKGREENPQTLFISFDPLLQCL